MVLSLHGALIRQARGGGRGAQRRGEMHPEEADAVIAGARSADEKYSCFLSVFTRAPFFSSNQQATKQQLRRPDGTRVHIVWGLWLTLYGQVCLSSRADTFDAGSIAMGIPRAVPACGAGTHSLRPYMRRHRAEECA